MNMLGLGDGSDTRKSGFRDPHTQKHLPQHQWDVVDDDIADDLADRT